MDSSKEFPYSVSLSLSASSTREKASTKKLSFEEGKIGLLASVPSLELTASDIIFSLLAINHYIVETTLPPLPPG